jgi:hypothetical protein
MADTVACAAAVAQDVPPIQEGLPADQPPVSRGTSTGVGRSRRTRSMSMASTTNSAVGEKLQTCQPVGEPGADQGSNHGMRPVLQSAAAAPIVKV